MGVEYFGEAPGPVALRRMKSGHILRPPVPVPGTDNLFFIRCEGADCGWFSAPFLKDGGMGQTEAERAAWMHRTEPTLLVAGSSDILPAMRRATVEELVAKLRRDGPPPPGTGGVPPLS